MDNPTTITFISKIVWITPAHEQGQMPEGIGVQLAEEDIQRVHEAIEAILPNAFSMNRKMLY